MNCGVVAMIIGTIVLLIAAFFGVAWTLGMLCRKVNQLMKRTLELESQNEKVEQEKQRRREILTSSEMILGGRPEYRATSADE